jgi:hypothetical protein
MPDPKPLPAAVSPPRSNADFFLNKPKPKREKPKYEASEARNENSMLFSLDALKAAAKSSDDIAPPKSQRVDENLLTMGTGGGVELFNAPLIQIDAPLPPQPVAKKAASRAPTMATASPELDFAPPKKAGKGWLVAIAAVAVVGGGGFFAYTNLLPAETPAVASTSAPVETAAPTAANTAEPETTAAPEPSASEAPSTTTGDEGTKAPPSDRGSSSTGSTDRGSSSSGDSRESDSRGSQGSTPPSTGGGKKDEPEEDESTAPPFSTDAAKSALSSAASNAASCKTSDGPTGSGKVQVTFVPSGRVTSANVVSGPFGGTAVGGCIARTFRQARVPKFSGDAQIVSKSFNIP